MLAAINGDRKKWNARKSYANTVFYTNLRKNGRLQSITSGLSGQMVGNRAVMTYEAKAKVSNIFGGITGKSEQNLTIRASAEYDYDTGGPARLLPNESTFK